MKEKVFLPGFWQEEIDVLDFIRLNKNKNFQESLFQPVAGQKINCPLVGSLYDETKVFKYLKPFLSISIHQKIKKFTKEEILYLETMEQKKMIETKLIQVANQFDRNSFIQPDFSAIGLYGTKRMIKQKKDYLVDMEKQLQNNEWYEKRLKHIKQIEVLEKFEKFCEANHVKIKKPAVTSIEFLNAVLFSVIFSCLEESDTIFNFFNILEVVDIFLTKEIEAGELLEDDAQRLIDEFYLKCADIQRDIGVESPFAYSFVLNSDTVTATTYRILESALKYSDKKVPFQIIVGDVPLHKQLQEQLNRLFHKDFDLAFSQSFRRNTVDLSLTSNHNFFLKGIDNTFTLGSLNLEKLLLLAINDGKDYETGKKLYRVTKGLKEEEIDFSTVWKVFESYLRYFITIYTEKVNGNMYYLDQNKFLPFRASMTESYPHYLVNIAYHRVNPVITILTAIKENKFIIKKEEKGLIRKISPTNNDKNEFIAERINEIIHEEMTKMKFYKNSKYNVVFFAENAFFEKEDEFDLNKLSPETFYKSSFSGFISLAEEKFFEFLETFPQKSYSHIRLSKKK